MSQYYAPIIYYNRSEPVPVLPETGKSEQEVWSIDHSDSKTWSPDSVSARFVCQAVGQNQSTEFRQFVVDRKDHSIETNLQLQIEVKLNPLLYYDHTNGGSASGSFSSVHTTVPYTTLHIASNLVSAGLRDSIHSVHSSTDVVRALNSNSVAYFDPAQHPNDSSNLLDSVHRTFEFTWVSHKYMAWSPDRAANKNIPGLGFTLFLNFRPNIPISTGKWAFNDDVKRLFCGPLNVGTDLFMVRIGRMQMHPLDFPTLQKNPNAIRALASGLQYNGVPFEPVIGADVSDSDQTISDRQVASYMPFVSDRSFVAASVDVIGAVTQTGINQPHAHSITSQAANVNVAVMHPGAAISCRTRWDTAGQYASTMLGNGVIEIKANPKTGTTDLEMDVWVVWRGMRSMFEHLKSFYNGTVRSTNLEAANLVYDVHVPSYLDASQAKFVFTNSTLLGEGVSVIDPHTYSISPLNECNLSSGGGAAIDGSLDPITSGMVTRYQIVLQVQGGLSSGPPPSLQDGATVLGRITNVRLRERPLRPGIENESKNSAVRPPARVPYPHCVAVRHTSEYKMSEQDTKEALAAMVPHIKCTFVGIVSDYDGGFVTDELIGGSNNTASVGGPLSYEKAKILFHHVPTDSEIDEEIKTMATPPQFADQKAKNVFYTLRRTRYYKSPLSSVSSSTHLGVAQNLYFVTAAAARPTDQNGVSVRFGIVSNPTFLSPTAYADVVINNNTSGATTSLLALHPDALDAENAHIDIGVIQQGANVNLFASSTFSNLANLSAKVNTENGATSTDLQQIFPTDGKALSIVGADDTEIFRLIPVDRLKLQEFLGKQKSSDSVRISMQIMSDSFVRAVVGIILKNIEDTSPHSFDPRSESVMQRIASHGQAFQSVDNPLSLTFRQNQTESITLEVTHTLNPESLLLLNPDNSSTKPAMRGVSIPTDTLHFEMEYLDTNRTTSEDSVVEVKAQFGNGKGVGTGATVPARYTYTYDIRFNLVEGKSDFFRHQDAMYEGVNLLGVSPKFMKLMKEVEMTLLDQNSSNATASLSLTNVDHTFTMSPTLSTTYDANLHGQRAKLSIWVINTFSSYGYDAKLTQTFGRVHFPSGVCIDSWDAAQQHKYSFVFDCNLYNVGGNVNSVVSQVVSGRQNLRDAYIQAALSNLSVRVKSVQTQNDVSAHFSLQPLASAASTWPSWFDPAKYPVDTSVGKASQASTLAASTPLSKDIVGNDGIEYHSMTTTPHLVRVALLSKFETSAELKALDNEGTAFEVEILCSGTLELHQFVLNRTDIFASYSSPLQLGGVELVEKSLGGSSHSPYVLRQAAQGHGQDPFFGVLRDGYSKVVKVVNPSCLQVVHASDSKDLVIGSIDSHTPESVICQLANEVSVLHLACLKTPVNGANSGHNHIKLQLPAVLLDKASSLSGLHLPYLTPETLEIVDWKFGGVVDVHTNKRFELHCQASCKLANESGKALLKYSIDRSRSKFPSWVSCEIDGSSGKLSIQGLANSTTMGEHEVTLTVVCVVTKSDRKTRRNVSARKSIQHVFKLAVQQEIRTLAHDEVVRKQTQTISAILGDDYKSSDQAIQATATSKLETDPEIALAKCQICSVSVRDNLNSNVIRAEELRSAFPVANIYERSPVSSMETMQTISMQKTINNGIENATTETGQAYLYLCIDGFECIDVSQVDIQRIRSTPLPSNIFVSQAETDTATAANSDSKDTSSSGATANVGRVLESYSDDISDAALETLDNCIARVEMLSAPGGFCTRFVSGVKRFDLSKDYSGPRSTIPFLKNMKISFRDKNGTVVDFRGLSHAYDIEITHRV